MGSFNADSSHRVHLLSSVASVSEDAALRAIVWFAVVVACFNLNHPFGGIVNDNILYLVQALLRTSPEIYGGDAFFQWGSQDRYTLFSPIYSFLISYIGVQEATIGLLLLSQALFLIASFALVCTLIPNGIRGFSMLFIVCTVGVYGGWFLFRMAEPFLTPRGFVEAATLFSITLLVSGRHWLALVVLAASALLHPIMALAGMVYWWIYLLLDDRRWWWLITLALFPMAAGLVGILPFNQLFQTFDGEWLAILVEDNSNLFVTLWRHFDWAMVVFDATVLYLGLQVTEGITRRALRAALLTAAVTLGATFIFADLLHNVLLTTTQPWRALWIVHWLAAAASALVAWRLWRAGETGRLIAGLLMFAFVTRGLITSLGACGLAILVFQYRDRVSVGRGTVNLALIALATGAFTSWLSIVAYVQRLAAVDSTDALAAFVIRALSKPFPLLVLASGIIFFGLIHKQRMRVSALAALALLPLSAPLWDQRTPFWRYVESIGLGAHPFSRIVAPNQEVLWYGGATVPWIMMQRRSYYSDNQKSGQMFSREMAIQLNRRKKAMEILSIQEDVCKLMNALNSARDSCQPDLETLTQVCQVTGDLDFIVLETRVANRWIASWTWPAAPTGAHYYLYECKALARA